MLNVRILVVAACLIAAPAFAGTVVFDNYPIDGTTNAYTIGPADLGYSVSNSFTLNSPATLTGVNFGVWLYSGSAVSSVDWSIGTQFFGNEIASGTASIASSTFLFSSWGYDVVSLSFALPNIGVSSGTLYYLTLGNAVATDGPVYWDQNNGIGPDGGGIIARQTNTLGFRGAESFQLLGDSSVPEPASCALIGSGLLALGVLRLRKTRHDGR
ncbi:MAG: PEP-CTERM sorting domain-containing protein [Acidobacteriota bacterium]